jgi:hypothetical protein
MVSLAASCHAGDLLTEPDSSGGPPNGPAPVPSRRVERATGDAQTDTVAATLAEPYSVRVLDGEGRPVAGATVDWRVVDGGGAVAPAVSATDASGIARATHTLGLSLGWQRVHATVGSASPAAFASFARHGAVHAMAYEVDASDVGMGEPIAPAIRIVLRDRYGNVATAASGQADIALVEGSGTPLATLSGTLEAPIAAGRAVFGDVRVSLVGSGYKLRVAAVGRNAESKAFSVTLPLLP